MGGYPLRPGSPFLNIFDRIQSMVAKFFSPVGCILSENNLYKKFEFDATQDWTYCHEKSLQEHTADPGGHVIPEWLDGAGFIEKSQLLALSKCLLMRQHFTVFP